MIPEKKYNPVNWIDGMKLNKNHFISFERWIADTYKDGINLILNDFNYGLIDPLPNKETALDLLANIDETNQLNIKVMTCRGITRGGYRIEITPEIIQKMKYPEENIGADFNINEAESEEFAIIVSVNTEERIPTGIPDEEEIPFRHPFVMPLYKVQAVPARQVNSGQFWTNHLIVGKFQIIAGEVHFEEDYIPPCSRILAHGNLVNHFHHFKAQHGQISRAAVEYIKTNRSSGKKLEMNIIYIFEKLVSYCTNAFFSNEGFYISQPPVFWVDFYIKLAKTFKGALNCMIEYDREEILNLFNQWISIRDFENAQYYLINLEYDHQNIQSSLEAIGNFLTLLGKVAEKMAFADKTAPKPAEEPKKPAGSKVKIVRINK